VAAAVGDTVVEGFIDLLVEAPEGYVIVDYKTDAAPSDDAIDEALERYSVQGAAYGLALERAIGTPASRCLFVFARAGGAVEREVADLRGTIAAVEARVGALS
jgi:ATP-dependent helicase/nuclease subunit A